ncbi:MAG: hypothetical protein QXK71_03450 [Pyrobaculum sp.]
MDKIRSEELEHLVELAKLKAAVESEYLREFIDGVIRETYLRLKIFDVLSLPEVALEPSEKKPLEQVVRALEEMCRRYEGHLAEVKKLRELAKTPLELELVAALEKSLERSHVNIRMLINALTESRR